MRVKGLALLGLFWFSSLGALLGQDITLSGIVRDASGEPVVGISVADTLSRRGAVTNTSGYFSLRAPAGAQVLRVSHVSYARLYVPLHAERDSFLNLTVEPRTAETVTITADPLAVKPLSQMSVSTIPMSVVKSLPALMGERDVLKALALMPGVTTGIEGTSGLLVRGGSPDQNLMLLDGAPVYNVSHLFGFLSVFNPDAIKDVALYKGGFPARYGGRLSSVLDITMREGATSEHRGEAGIGIISSRVLLEGPLGKSKKGSYLVSARSSYLGLLLIPVKILYAQGDADAYYNYWMVDFNAKMNYQAGKNGRISLSLYGGNDNFNAVDGSFGPESRFGLNWGNQTATLRYTHLLGSKWFGQAMGIYSRYQYQLLASQKDSVRTGDTTYVNTNRVRSQSLVADIGAKYKLEGYLSSSLTLRLGAEVTRHQFTPSLFRIQSDTTEDRQGSGSIYTVEAGAYAEATWKPKPWLEINGGLRLSAYSVAGRNYAAPEPRLSAGIQLPANFQFKGSYSRMKQYLHLLTNSGVGLPNDIWVPVTAVIPPSQSDQFALGLEKDLPARKLHFSVEAYYKRLSSLTDYARGSNFLEVFSADWQNYLLTGGTGRIRGLEFFAQRTEGKVSGWVSYTLSKNERSFAQTDGGAWYPFRYDRRHVATVAGIFTLSKHWKASTTFSYSSGFPVSVPIARAQGPEGGWTWVYGPKGNYRTSSYQRLDVGFDHIKTSKNGNEKIFSIGCYNTLNRKNPFYIDIKGSSDPVTNVRSYNLVQRSFLPILPYFGWSWKF